MRTIFHRLTPRHFAVGWPIFWRMNAGYWVSLLHGGLALWLAFRLEDRAGDSVAARWPAVLDRPLPVIATLAVAVFLLLWPPAAAARRALSRMADAEFYRSQFGLVSGLSNLSRGLATLLGALVLFFAVDGGRSLSGEPVLRWGLAVFAFILAAVLTAFVGVYGWLAGQWNELFKGDRP